MALTAALLTNNATSSLAAGITNVATSLTVATGEGAKFPNPAAGEYFYVTLSTPTGTTIEIVKCTARATDVFTVVRGQDGTSGSAFSIADIVELRPVAILFREKADVTPQIIADSISTKQNNYSPTGYVATVTNETMLRVTPTVSTGITGLVAKPAGSRVTIKNVSTDFLLWLENENTSSTAANRFKLLNGFPAFLMPGDSIGLIYDSGSSRWEVSEWGSRGEAMGLAAFDDLYIVSFSAAGFIGRFGGSASGTGATWAQTPYGMDATERVMGGAQLSTGTTNAGRGNIGANINTQMNQLVPTLGPALSVARVARETAVSGTETYTLTSGFIDGQNGTFTDGVAWELRWTGAAEEWSHTRWAATVATRSNVGSPAVDGTYIWLLVFMNANWTRADFIYSQDSMAFTLAEAITTGIPTITQLTGWSGINVVKSAGTTARLTDCDFCGMRMDVTRG